MIRAHQVDDINNKEVSIVVAVRNEEGYINKCLDSLINQDFPHEKYEIIVIDGMSDDKTRELLAIYQSSFPDLITIFDNPDRLQSSGRNIGIKNAKGKIIWMFDGHAYVHTQFLSTLARKLNGSPSNVAGVGGMHIAPADEKFLGKVISDVQKTIVGGAGTSFRQTGQSLYADTISFPAYKKNVLQRIGSYDERLVTGEDLELNWRIRKAGFKLMVCLDLVTYYYRKYSSFASLLKRMIKYGMWRAIVTKKHPGSFKILFSIPVLIVISCASLPLFAFVYPALASLISLGLTMYLITILASSIYLSVKRRSLKYLISAPVYVIEHLGIGLGFIAGILKRS